MKDIKSMNFKFLQTIFVALTILSVRGNTYFCNSSLLTPCDSYFSRTCSELTNSIGSGKCKTYLDCSSGRTCELGLCSGVSDFILVECPPSTTCNANQLPVCNVSGLMACQETLDSNKVSVCQSHYDCAFGRSCVSGTCVGEVSGINFIDCSQLPVVGLAATSTSQNSTTVSTSAINVTTVPGSVINTTQPDSNVDTFISILNQNGISSETCEAVRQTVVSNESTLNQTPLDNDFTQNLAVLSRDQLVNMRYQLVSLQNSLGSSAPASLSVQIMKDLVYTNQQIDSLSVATTNSTNVASSTDATLVSDNTNTTTTDNSTTVNNISNVGTVVVTNNETAPVETTSGPVLVSTVNNTTTSDPTTTTVTADQTSGTVSTQPTSTQTTETVVVTNNETAPVETTSGPVLVSSVDNTTTTDPATTSSVDQTTEVASSEPVVDNSYTTSDVVGNGTTSTTESSNVTPTDITTSDPTVVNTSTTDNAVDSTTTTTVPLIYTGTSTDPLSGNTTTVTNSDTTITNDPTSTVDSTVINTGNTQDVTSTQTASSAPTDTGVYTSDQIINMPPTYEHVSTNEVNGQIVETFTANTDPSPNAGQDGEDEAYGAVLESMKGEETNQAISPITDANQTPVPSTPEEIIVPPTPQPEVIAEPAQVQDPRLNDALVKALTMGNTLLDDVNESQDTNPKTINELIEDISLDLAGNVEASPRQPSDCTDKLTFPSAEPARQLKRSNMSADTYNNLIRVLGLYRDYVNHKASNAISGQNYDYLRHLKENLECLTSHDCDYMTHYANLENVRKLQSQNVRKLPIQGWLCRTFGWRCNNSTVETKTTVTTEPSHLMGSSQNAGLYEMASSRKLANYLNKSEIEESHLLVRHLLNTSDSVEENNKIKINNLSKNVLDNLSTLSNNEQIKLTSGSIIDNLKVLSQNVEDNSGSLITSVSDLKLSDNIALMKDMNADKLKSVLGMIQSMAEYKLNEEFTQNGLTSRADYLIGLSKKIKDTRNQLESQLPIDNVLISDLDKLTNSLDSQVALLQSASNAPVEDLEKAREYVKADLKNKINSIDTTTNADLIQQMGGKLEALNNSKFGQSLTASNIQGIVHKVTSAFLTDLQSLNNANKQSNFTLDADDIEYLADNIVDELKASREEGQQATIELKSLEASIEKLTANINFKKDSNKSDAMNVADMFINYENNLSTVLSSDDFYSNLKTYVANYYDILKAHTTVASPIYEHTNVYKTLTQDLVDSQSATTDTRSLKTLGNVIHRQLKVAKHLSNDDRKFLNMFNHLLTEFLINQDNGAFSRKLSDVIRVLKGEKFEFRRLSLDSIQKHRQLPVTITSIKDYVSNLYNSFIKADESTTKIIGYYDSATSSVNSFKQLFGNLASTTPSTENKSFFSKLAFWRTLREEHKFENPVTKITDLLNNLSKGAETAKMMQSNIQGVKKVVDSIKGVLSSVPLP